MTIAIILILAAVALFLILRDDHDNSYTRREPKSDRENGRKSVYQKSVPTRHRTADTPRTVQNQFPKPTPQQPARPAPQQPRPNPVMGRTIVPEEKQYRSWKPDFSYLDGIDFDPNLPEKTMSSFIAGVQGYCSQKDLGGVVGYVSMDPVTGSLDVYSTDDVLMGYLPMKDRAAFLSFNPDHVPCPFAGHIGLSTTGRYYADIRIILPSTRTFVEDSIRSFLG